jgi:predicted PhzF superfamily epimerase YddE/YHI9
VTLLCRKTLEPVGDRLLFPPETTGDAKVWIFTRAGELPFAGYPVIGSAFILAELLCSQDTIEHV